MTIYIRIDYYSYTWKWAFITPTGEVKIVAKQPDILQYNAAELYANMYIQQR